MDTLFSLLATYGVAIAFFSMLIEQLGVPLPAYPVLVVAAALSVDGHHSAVSLYAATVAACLLADVTWYVAGRSHGARVLGTICRISINPDTCVRQTQSLFERWGVWSLLVAKFVPGFGTLATALSGSSQLRLSTFVAVDALGSALYIGIGLWLGVHFHETVHEVLATFGRLGHWGLMLFVVALAIFLAAKWWQRRRLLREHQGSRITVHELQQLFSAGRRPTLVDVRPASRRAQTGTIPGAVHLPLDRVDEDQQHIPRHAEIVVFCECPNEVSAAHVARQLRRSGFLTVRPLAGGLDAWIASGLPVDSTSPSGVAALQSVCATSR
ncbi:DedA family protein/thiosulfate sulfurtransferase GlpE [Variovorax sp. J31P207]|uniref:DedA family protein/thiosulfate sulfurtransferase GlpE n=1 Tax=Variovorax sp. J31P207 TaxID=3053510 RepID=UPI00257920A8|nr:DedA family protein/thiosulfate sulfurtransferase GlpE [Variovorax sp. J31P207]MDM0069928.1 DedA family protein/thiosulfate sulfurtransferase GlpE [Variovorax sp. J31P207]